MEALRELFLTLGLDADEASFASATAAVDLLEKGLELAVEVAKALGEALVETVASAVDYADKIGDAAVKTGVSTTHLQELEYAAVQSGSSFDGVVQSLVFMNRSLFEAATAGGEAGETFARLGVRVRNTDGTIADGYTTYLAIADAIAKLPPGAERSATAMKLLGRAGAESVPMLSQGSAELVRLAAEAQAMGAILGPKQLAEAKVFADTWSAMGRVFESVRNDLGLMLVQELLPIVNGFKEWWLQNNNLVRSKLKTFIDGVRIAIRALANVVEFATRAFDFFVAATKIAAVAVGSYFVASAYLAAGSLTQLLVNLALNTAAAVAYGASMVVAGLEAAAAWVAAMWPVLALTAALLIAYLVADDVRGALNGQNSLIGAIGPKWTAFLDEFTSEISDNPIVNALKAAIFYLSDLEGRLLPLLKNSWASALLQPITSAIELVFKLFRGTATFADYIKTLPFFGLWFERMQADVAMLSGESGEAPSISTLWGGGGSSPEATAASSVSASPLVLAPKMNSNITIQTQLGQSPQEIANAVRDAQDEWFQAELTRTAGTTNGS